MQPILHLLQTIAAFFLILSVIVFIHEFGHYLAARLCGVRVTAFSLGFGKEIWGFNDKRGTRWKISLLPLGGYVKMYGDAGAASTPDNAELQAMSAEDRAVAFHYKPLWKKAIVVVAGPLANFLLTIAIFFGFMFGNGVLSTEPVVGDILPGSAAEQAHLQKGDRVLSIDGTKIEKFNDIPYLIVPNMGTPVLIRILRDDAEQEITVIPHLEEVSDDLGNKGRQARLGITSVQHTVENVGVVGALKESVLRTYHICEMSLRVAGQMITGQRDASELKGPLGIAKVSGQAAQQGFTTILWFIALLSVNLGMVNLFPVPMLDGGHLVFYAIEGLFRRPMHPRVMEYSYRLGAALIAMLMVYAFYNDIVNMLAKSTMTQ